MSKSEGLSNQESAYQRQLEKNVKRGVWFAQILGIDPEAPIARNAKGERCTLVDVEIENTPRDTPDQT